MIEFALQIFHSVSLSGKLHIQSSFYFDICVMNSFILSFTSCSTRETTQLYSPSQAADGWWIRKQIYEQRLSDKLDSGRTLPRSRTSIRTPNLRNTLSITTRNSYLALLFNPWRHLWVCRAFVVHLREMGTKHPFFCESAVPRSSDLAGGRLEGAVHHGSCSVEYASWGCAPPGCGRNACGQHASRENCGNHGWHSHAAGNQRAVSKSSSWRGRIRVFKSGGTFQIWWVA